MDGLSVSDAAHAVGALRVVAEGHVLAERHHSLGVQRLPDVHASCVHLCNTA